MYKTVFLLLCCTMLSALDLNLLRPWNRAELSIRSGALAVAVDGSGNRGAGVTLVNHPVEPATAYRVNLTVSGSVTLIGMVNAPGYPKQRFDFLPGAILEEKPQILSGVFTTPAGCRRVTIVLFVWNQKGGFEIRSMELVKQEKSPVLKLSQGKFSGRLPDDETLTEMFSEEFRWGKFVNGIRTRVEPAGWEFVNYDGNHDVPRGGLVGTPAGTEHALAVPAVSHGTAGWHADWHVLTPGRPVVVKGAVRRSADYRNNRPVAFLSLADRSKKTVLARQIPLPELSEKFSEFGMLLPVSEIPASAAYYRITLASSGKQGTGTLFFDRIRIGVPRSIGNVLRLRPDQLGGWYFKGEPVRLLAKGSIPSNLVTVEGRVEDSRGRTVDSFRCSAAVLRKEGLRWMPAEPGFYRIYLAALFADGTKHTVREDYKDGIWQTNQYRIFTQDFIPVAVSSASRGTQKTRWLGFAISGGKLNQEKGINDLEYDLAKLFGSGFVRLHGCTWGDFEPEKGKFNWFADPLVNRAAADKLGILFSICGTARWASSHPDDVRMQYGWLPMYSTFAPAKMQDWKDFLTAFIHHYRDRVNKYELWNEPHFKGFSIFWNDTPEKFVELMKAGSEVIRKEQPDAEIWMGGIGQRYLPFYEEVVKQNITEYFDVLPLHGRSYNPESFRETARRLNRKIPVVSTSEWHSILVQPRSAPPNHKSSGQELAKVMMLDLLSQLKAGLREITAFCTLGYGRIESLAFKKEMGDALPQASGFFDPVPFTSVRYPALILQHAAAELPDGKEFLGEGVFGGIKTIAFAVPGGNVLLLWHDEKTALNPEPVSGALMPESSVCDWEGRAVSFRDWKIEPETFYYLRNFDPAKLPGLKKDAGVLIPNRPALKPTGPEGVYSTLPLIGKDGTFLEQNALWVESGWRTFGTVGENRAKFALHISDDSMQLAVDVRDPLFCQKQHGEKLFDGDSIQFAFDCENKGYADMRAEFQAGLSATGPEVYKEFAPATDGDLPSVYTPATHLVPEPNAVLRVIDIPGGKRYLLRLELSELYPLSFRKNMPLHFSLVVNEHDGVKRAGYLRWAHGIGDGDKDPVRYGVLRPH